MYLCNKVRYGYLNVPARPHNTILDDSISFSHLILEATSKKPYFVLFYIYLKLFKNRCLTVIDV